MEQRRVLDAARRDEVIEAPITGLGFLKQGILAVASGDGALRFIPPEEPSVLVRAHETGAAVLVLAVDIDGAAVLTGGDDGRLMRTSPDGRSSIVIEAPGRQIDVVAVSSTGGLRAAAAGRNVWIIDRDGREVGRSDDHPSTVTGIAFNPKGKRLAASHYDGVTLWWTATFGGNPKRLTWRGSHIGVSWSPDGSVVITATQEATLHGWRLADGADMQMNGYAAKVRSMDWLAKPMTLATAGGDCVAAWSFTGGGPMGKPPLEIGQGIGTLVSSVSVHPNQKVPLIAAGFADGRVALCGIFDDRVVRLRPADGNRIFGLAWSPDGTRLAVAAGCAVSLFDLAKASA